MGSEEDNWKEACFKTVSFGDGLGGSCAQLAIEDCSFRFMGVNTRRDLSDNIYMDDISLPLYDPAGDLSKMVEEVDTGLKNANFEVKEWAETGNTNITVKFLSYSYNPMKNTFSVRPKINWSAKKRGARKSPDVTNVEELEQHIKDNGMTRPSV